jgi:D-tyrosyl-tRNA(Tyr) deacylase
MRAVIQRVTHASVTIDENIHAKINRGLLVLLGIEDLDGEDDINWLVKKIIQMRIFNDAEGVMNKSLQDIDGELLVVSQFTLHASTKKGNRPSYLKASKPPTAVPLYEAFLAKASLDLNKEIKAGVFGADMKVDLLNDGPVTIIVDTKLKE